MNATTTIDRPQQIADPFGGPGSAPDVPRRPRRVTAKGLVEVVGSALAAGAVVWLPFDVAGLSAPFGFVVCWVIAFVLIYGTISSLNHGALVAKDRVATFCIWTGGMIAMVPLVAVLAYVVYRGAPVVANHFPHFLLADFRYASGNAPISQVGVAHAIVGTVEQVGIATLITAPLAVLAATYLAESNGLFARLVRTMADAKVGLPSIITGLFVYLVWVAPRHTNGYSGVAASFALATMMLPIITRTAEEMIRLVPGSLREAAYALGAPRWKVTLRVILPTARAGIVSAVILGIARAVGETAPVLFTAHGSTRMNWNPFHGVQADLPLTGLEAILSTSNRLKAEGWGDLLVLVVLVLLLFVAARAVGSGKKKKRLRALFRRMSKPKEEVVVP